MCGWREKPDLIKFLRQADLDQPRGKKVSKEPEVTDSTLCANVCCFSQVGTDERAGLLHATKLTWPSFLSTLSEVGVLGTGNRHAKHKD